MCNDQLTIKCTKLTLCAVVISTGRLVNSNTFTRDGSRFHYVTGMSYFDAYQAANVIILCHHQLMKL